MCYQLKWSIHCGELNSKKAERSFAKRSISFNMSGFCSRSIAIFKCSISVQLSFVAACFSTNGWTKEAACLHAFNEVQIESKCGKHCKQIHFMETCSSFLLMTFHYNKRCTRFVLFRSLVTLPLNGMKTHRMCKKGDANCEERERKRRNHLQRNEVSYVGNFMTFYPPFDVFVCCMIRSHKWMLHTWLVNVDFMST